MKLIEKTYPYLKNPIYHARLENGLRLVLIPKKGFHETYAAMTVEFGSLDNKFTSVDNTTRTYPAGIAHFLEHKLFETADSGDILQEFARCGANANAYTSFHQTCYLFSTTGELRQPLAWLQTMVRETHFTEESVEREKEIIAQEIDMYADDPDHRLYLGILKNLYPNTALAEDIAGSRASIQEISVTVLRENFQRFYRPDTMTLVVMGDIDVHEVFEWVDEEQAGIYVRQEARQVSYPIKKEAIVEHGKESWEVALPKLALGLRGNDLIPQGKEQYYRMCLSFLLAMLIGRTSKRYQSLYDANKIDHSLSFHVEVLQGYHFVVVTGDTAEPITVSSQLRRAFSNFEEDQDVTQEHFQILKNELYGEFIRNLNSSEATVSYFVSYLSETESIFDIPELLTKLTLEEVLEVGRQFMSQCDVADFMIFPK